MIIRACNRPTHHQHVQGEILTRMLHHAPRVRNHHLHQLAQVENLMQCLQRVHQVRHQVLHLLHLQVDLHIEAVHRRVVAVAVHHAHPVQALHRVHHVRAEVHRVLHHQKAVGDKSEKNCNYIDVY